MKISEQWLREWVPVELDTAALAHRLTMAGLEVDGIEAAAPPVEDVVVAEVVACEPHPDADRLTLCTVHDGSDTPLQVVCGAPNVRVGLRAPLARVGGRLPDGTRIRRAKLRGVASTGMLCSARELGLSEEAEGLLALPDDAPVGTDLRHYMHLDDAVIEVDLTPNRGDCLGMRGVAREVAALTGADVADTAPEAVPAQCDDTRAVTLDDPEGCPCYVGRVVRGLDPAAPTPVWMRERLRRAGVRAINAVVDVTNYVMLERGQPMHGFDLARLEGGIRVRQAQPGETLTLLGDETITLQAGTLVIADAARPLALAGVMGGADSGVGAGTTDVLLESAFFAPHAIAGRARSYGLHTDSSHRFERGVDPAGQEAAMERATALLCAIAGGEPGPPLVASDAARRPRGHAVTLRAGQIERLLGIRLERDRVEDILGRLGMGVESDGEDWCVQVPPQRFDITGEADLIEELARVYGYDAIPEKRPATVARIQPVPEGVVPLARLRTALVDRDYQEAITYSFVDAPLQAALDPDHTPVPLANPLSAELAVMRTSLWPGLVKAAVHNRHRQHERVRLFEAGLRFRGALDDLEQTPVVGGLIMGPVVPEQWGEKPRPVDFFDLKGDVEALLALTGEPEAFRFVADRHPALHPGQSARLERDGATVGWLGALHPATAEAVDLDEPPLVFEITQQALGEARLPAVEPLSRFPSIRRDLAVIVDQAVEADGLRRAVRDAAGAWLQESGIFDVYAGKGVPDGAKSLGIRLILRDSGRTLTDTDVEDVVGRVVARLGQEFDARLRG